MAELNDYFYLLFFQSSMKYMEIPILKLSKKRIYYYLYINAKAGYISVTWIYLSNSTSIKQIVLKKRKFLAMLELCVIVGI